MEGFGSKRLRSMGVQVKDGVPIEQGMVDLERVLRREHHIRPGGENDFTIARRGVLTELGWRSHCLNVRSSSMPVTRDALAVPVEVMIHLEAACHAHLGGTAQHREGEGS